MKKTIHTVLFGIILLFVVYQFLLSFNFLPFVFSGQDLFAVILLFVALSQLMISWSIESAAKKNSLIEDELPVKSSPGKEPVDLANFDKTEEKSLFKYVLNLQRYLKDVSDIKDVINKILIASARITGSQRASVLLFDKKSDELYIHRTLGWDSKEIKLTANTRMKPGEGIAGRVFLDEKPFVMNQTDERSEIELKDKYRTSAFACFPLLAGWEVIGVLNLTEKELGTYSQHEVDLISFIVNEASLHLLRLSNIRRSKF